MYSFSTILYDVVWQPYFMIYGELFAGEIDPHCGDGPDEPVCVPGRWLNPLLMTCYLLVIAIINHHKFNIILYNLIIFSNYYYYYYYYYIYIYYY